MKKEKLAFQTHRGLWQFVRMPFSYKNIPSIFQRIMKNVLALFLWIFTLFYIDDIIIFSLTLEDHISHLDQVFKAIEDSGVTLSITKCQNLSECQSSAPHLGNSICSLSQTTNCSPCQPSSFQRWPNLKIKVQSSPSARPYSWCDPAYVFGY